MVKEIPTKWGLFFLALFIVSMFGVFVLQDLLMRCDDTYFDNSINTGSMVDFHGNIVNSYGLLPNASNSENISLMALLIRHGTRRLPMGGQPVLGQDHIYQSLNCKVSFNGVNLDESWGILVKNPRTYLKTIFKF